MKKNPCTEKQKMLSRAQLPLCCPALNERLQDGHPRVYLDIETTGRVTCPYCSVHYILM